MKFLFALVLVAVYLIWHFSRKKNSAQINSEAKTDSSDEITHTTQVPESNLKSKSFQTVANKVSATTSSVKALFLLT